MATAKTTAATSTKADNDAVSAREIEENIQRIRNDISALAGSLKDYGTGKGTEYKAKASAAGQDLTKMSQDVLKDLTSELKNCEEKLSSQVRRHPLQAIGIAAGVGFLAALLARRH